MDAIDKGLSDAGDITLGRLLELCAANAAEPLVFSYEGRAIKAGYHITEVKAGHFSALDCGANPEAWSEIFVQLWDVAEDGRTHMTAGKFAAIVRKVSDHVELDGTAKLTFEISDGVRPIQLFYADIPSLEDGCIRVELMPRPASCKPRDRWLAEQAAVSSSCCSPQTTTACCS